MMNGVRLLDGGMGQEIFRRTGRPEEGWSPLVGIDHFEVVRDLHAEFLQAGAEIITTNTYALGRWRMNMAGHSERFAEANQAACAAAEAARDAVNPAALIAGALGPLRGSYQPDNVPRAAVMEPEYAEQALVLAPHVDLFVCETLTTSDEAVCAARAARSAGKPVWVAYTLHEMGPAVLRGGETITAAVRALDDLEIDAILINCTSPEAVDAAIDELVTTSAVAVGAYANAFLPIPVEYGHEKTVHHIGDRPELTPDLYAEHAMRWFDAGATIVGGCCEVGPSHIAKLKALIEAR